MSTTLLLVRYWLPVIVMMTIISFASTEAFSSEHTSRFIGPVLQWLLPEASPETLDRLLILIRKGAHVAEYAILALLLGRAIQRTFYPPQAGFFWIPFVSSLLIAGIYALVDEYHQTWVPSRTGAITDVLLDFSGALIGVALLVAIDKVRRRRQRPYPPSTE